MDVIKACYDGALGNETKKQECMTVNADTETTVKEALGKSSVTAVDVHQFNRMAQMQALATTNEALSSDTSSSSEEQNAQRKADMKALGIDVDVEPLKAHMFSKKVGASKIASTALSCLKANKDNINDCNYEQEYLKVVTSSTSRRRRQLRRLSSTTEKATIKREGAEQLLYRQILANSATSDGLQGINGTENIGDQGTYALLRNNIHRHADIEKAKSQIVGDYIADCRKSGETIASCKENATLMLQHDMKSQLSIDNTLIRSQFEMIQLELSCTGSQCQDDMKAQITQLDITENELKARKYNSAISSAAILKADCLTSGESSESCDTVAETEFMLLASNLKPDTKTRFMINTLTLQKQNGVVTELKKRKEITSIASYKTTCDDEVSNKITDDIKATLSTVNNASYIHQSNNDECNVFITLTMSDDDSIDNVENDAKNTIPKSLSISSRRRRLLTAVEVSSSITVSEVDPPGALYLNLCSNPVDYQGNLVVNINHNQNTCENWLAYLDSLLPGMDLTNPTCSMFKHPVTHAGTDYAVPNLLDHLTKLAPCCGGDASKMFLDLSPENKPTSQFDGAPLWTHDTVQADNCNGSTVGINIPIYQWIPGRNRNEFVAKSDVGGNCNTFSYVSNVCNGTHVIQTMRTCTTAECTNSTGNATVYVRTNAFNDAILMSNPNICFVFNFGNGTFGYTTSAQNNPFMDLKICMATKLVTQSLEFSGDITVAEIENKRSEITNDIAQALGVQPDVVTIISITEVVDSSRRRRLLSTTIVIVYEVKVQDDAAAQDTKHLMESASFVDSIQTKVEVTTGKSISVVAKIPIITSIFPSILRTKSKEHTYQDRFSEEDIFGVVSLTRNALSNHIMGYKPTRGYRSLQVLSNGTELVDKSESAILGFAIQSKDSDVDVSTNTFFAKSYGVYHSDGHTIYKSSLNVLGSDIGSSTKIISGIATFSLYGTNLGFNKDDLKGIYIRNFDCNPMIYYNSTYVECTTGLHQLVQGATLSTFMVTEVVVQTGKGNSTKDTSIGNFKVRLSEGYTLPIVSKVERTVHMFRPHAIVVDQETGEYIYWSDLKEKTIRRARYDGGKIALISNGKLTNSIRSMAMDDASKGYHRIYATDDNTGSIVIVPTNDTKAEINTLLSGLNDPRGIALDLSNRLVYFTELTGRIYLTSMDGENLEKNPTRPAKDKILLIRRPSNVRLNGITLDLSNKLHFLHKIYWSESNTNTIMRSTLEGLRIETVAGIDSTLVFPNDVIYDSLSKYLYFSEYFGSIYRLNAVAIARKQTTEPLREKVLNSLTGQSNIVRDEIMDISKVGGEYFFSLKD
jgi:hypothetical protein